MTGIEQNAQNRIEGDAFAEEMKRSLKALAKTGDQGEKARIFNAFLARFNAGAFDEREGNMSEHTSPHAASINMRFPDPSEYMGDPIQHADLSELVWSTPEDPSCPVSVPVSLLRRLDRAVFGIWLECLGQVLANRSQRTGEALVHGQTLLKGLFRVYLRDARKMFCPIGKAFDHRVFRFHPCNLARNFRADHVRLAELRSQILVSTFVGCGGRTEDKYDHGTEAANAQAGQRCSKTTYGVIQKIRHISFLILVVGTNSMKENRAFAHWAKVRSNLVAGARHD